MKLKIIISLSFLLCSVFIAEAQGIFSKRKTKEKTATTTNQSRDSSIFSITVSADGRSKQDAIDNALRNAIEQSYGAFISSDTRILDDQLIKDEIISVSYGNIWGYEEIGCYFNNERDLYEVTVKAHVSLTKLQSYAESKGATVEFAGAIFAQNVKRYMLNKDNEMKIMKNLIQLVLCSDNLFNLQLKVSDPIQHTNYREEGHNDVVYSIVGKVNVSLSSHGQALFEYVKKTIESLALTKEELAYAQQTGLPMYDFISARLSHPAGVGFNHSKFYKDFDGPFLPIYPQGGYWRSEWLGFYELLYPENRTIYLRNDYHGSRGRERVYIYDKDYVREEEASYRWLDPEYIMFGDKKVELCKAYGGLMAKKMLDFYVIPRFSDGTEGKNVLKQIVAFFHKGSFSVNCDIELCDFSLEDLEKIVSFEAVYDYFDAANWRTYGFWN